MNKKPSYEELEQKIKVLEGESAKLKQTEKELRQSEERCRLVTENVSDVLWIRDLDLNFTYISPAVERMTGYSIEEAMTLPMEQAYTPASVVAALTAFQEELALEEDKNSSPSRVRVVEMEGYRKDGSRIWTETKMTFLKDSTGRASGILGVSRDITKRKKTETELLKAREEWERTFDAIKDYIAILDNGYTIRRVNKAMADALGVTPEEAIGLTCYEHIHGTKEPPSFCPHTKLLLDGKEHSVEFKEDRLGGDVLFSVSPIYDAESHLCGSVHVARDITEQKRAEEALRENDAIFSAFLEHSPIYVFFKDKNIRSIRLSRNYEQMLGMPLHEVIGKPMDELFPSDLAKSMIADDMRVLSEGKRIDVVEEFGGRIYETTKFPVLKDGEPFVLAGFTMDITERKKAERALRESEKRYKQLFNHAPAGIYELDFHKQRFIAVNDVMCQYTGYSEEEFLTMNPYDILPDDAKALCMQRIRKLMAGESVPEAVEYKITKKDGKELWVALKIKPVYENGKVKGVNAVVHDITERCKMEQKLRQSEERLRSLSGELMKAQESERIRISKELHDEIGHSLAILKHRVRSIGKSLLAHQPQLSKDGDAAVELIDELLEKLRQISRDLNPAILENLGLLPAFRRLVESFMEECKIPVSLDVAEINGLFSKETARNLYRMFQEALTNIAKHANANHVNIQIRREKENVYFLIEDDGQGFDINEARGREVRCKGLGLTVMEERANLIGGTLKISSRDGERGTKILLMVPIDNRGVK